LVKENIQKNTTGDIFVGGKTLLQRILNKYGGRVWTGFIWLRIERHGWVL
jgi:hypothetical protein